jgi:hypothetical protein
MNAALLALRGTALLQTAGQVPGVYAGAADVIAALMLVLEFGMLRQALVRDQVRLYATQSALISVLAIVIAADRGLPDLYALAGLSAARRKPSAPPSRRVGRRGDAGSGGQLHAEPGQRGTCQHRHGGVRVLLLRLAWHS